METRVNYYQLVKFLLFLCFPKVYQEYFFLKIFELSPDYTQIIIFELVLAFTFIKITCLFGVNSQKLKYLFELSSLQSML